MRFPSRPYVAMVAESRTRKLAVLAMLLSVTASPALASDASSDVAGAGNLSAETTALGQGAVELRDLDRRVGRLEQKVDRFGVADPVPAPTPAELKRAEQEEERQAEFQRQVWTAP